MQPAKLGMAAALLALLGAGTYIVLNMNAGVAAGGGPGPVTADDSGATPEAKAAVVSANNAFALEMYGKLRQVETGNLFFSPYSIEAVLAMAAEGAGGITREELLAAARLPEDRITRQGGMAALHNALNPAKAEYRLSAANALWVQQDYALLPAFTAAVSRFYGGKAENLDFAGAPEPSRQRINRWVEERTADRIKELLAAGSITPDTRLVLTNAVYFKGRWINAFDPQLTTAGSFHRVDGNSVEAQFMYLQEGTADLPYAETANWQAVALPYTGSDLSLLIVLPAAGQPLSAFEAGLDAGQWTAVADALQSREVRVELPRFKFDTKYELNDQLMALGMRQAFDPQNADFSGMTQADKLYVSLVVHQAFVEVNEEGTEATAATGMVMETTSAPLNQPPLLRVDRPFLFAVRHDATGAVLFLGRVMDPTK